MISLIAAAVSDSSSEFPARRLEIVWPHENASVIERE
jgi:hypothetical protein